MNLRGMPSSHTTEDAVNLTPMAKGYGQEILDFWVYDGQSSSIYYRFTFRYFSHYRILIVILE